MLRTKNHTINNASLTEVLPADPMGLSIDVFNATGTDIEVAFAPEADALTNGIVVPDGAGYRAEGFHGRFPLLVKGVGTIVVTEG